MARNLSPKCKLCRRAGEKLFLKGDRCGTPKCAMVRRAYPPGVHGQKKRRRARSEFGEQLAMKQKIKRIYGVLEKQLKKYFKDVKNKPGVTGDLLMQKLEMRLDNVIFRAGFATSRQQARQLVRHSHFTVNGKRMNMPSYEVKVGDVIGVKAGKLKKEYFKNTEEAMAGRQNVLGWLEVDIQQKMIKIKSKPTKDDVGMELDVQMAIEYYSR
ncbi:MAG: 30S ribosomal protein S4 [Candidatus Moranbacteria bacterium CG_4_10_14_3_um_filter_44_15]|nr:MAG: 30S ribosomal protein S4 [Candidatus Moranbacteria bacterium CG06_land_8_20_14_3_00_43_56]PIV83777.1 MAG: 30S ribosomal protein S4 [Candidatus Moranbacteria bacterium CG17_big_fil_post_rev_8_21_14_2_50_44_12]PIW92969.1 MAG: 30S ribosomal protein S4 [Candidatus Moranbacteria bacterium CG_4_8_14_3_um_filter_43_15]PIX90448.1 MAG: 30S ribosomal protein S4 [Candidatus Moranbacteria bacterium CG_4_10_14_3_um_filter_44_15]PJA85350.1 MAG: 30S ribosomal protein S4 [Candidatus Moranbacteria bacte